MEPFALGAAVLLAASLMGMGGGAMYPKLVKGAGSVQSAEGRTAGKERDKKRKELERAANAPQSKLLGFFKRSQYYDPEQGVHRPPPDPEVEAQRRQAAAWARWRSWKCWLLDRLKSSGGRPPWWFPGQVLKPNTCSNTKITADDLKREPNCNYVLRFNETGMPPHLKGYVAVQLARETFGKDKLWLATKESEQ